MRLKRLAILTAILLPVAGNAQPPPSTQGVPMTVDANGNALPPQSAIPTFKFNRDIEAKSLSVTGTLGQGYIQLANNFDPPTVPLNSIRLYATSGNIPNWMGSDGISHYFVSTVNNLASGNIIVGGGTTNVVDSGIALSSLSGWTATSASTVANKDISGLLNNLHDIPISAITGLQGLTDPNANKLAGWDDTDNSLRFLTLGSGLSYDHATHTLSASGGVTNGGFGGVEGYVKASLNPVVPKGSGSDPDSAEARDPDIWYARGKYWMVYTGTRGLSTPFTPTVCLASSTDGTTWTKHGRILDKNGTAGQWNSGGVYSPSVYSDSATDELWLFITATVTDAQYYFGPHYIGLLKAAAAADWTNGANFVYQNSGNPILSPTAGWEVDGVYSPTVRKIGSTYTMWYSSANVGSARNVGVATASTLNGTWTKYAGNPVFPAATSTIPSTEELCVIQLGNGNLVALSDSGEGRVGIVVFYTTDPLGLSGWTVAGEVFRHGGSGWETEKASSSACFMPDGNLLIAYGGWQSGATQIGVMTARLAPRNENMVAGDARADDLYVNNNSTTLGITVAPTAQFNTIGPWDASILTLKGATANANTINVRNTSAAGYSAIGVLDQSAVQQGAIGYANSGTGSLTGLMFAATSSGVDYVIAPAGIEKFRFGPNTLTLASNVAIAFAGTGATTTRSNLGLGTLATQNGTFSGTSSGTNTGDQTITLTGDVTGTGTGSFAATIANNAVSNGKAAQMSANTIKGNNTGSTANAADLTVDQAKSLLAAGSTITGPITLFTKGVTVLTSGAPADIATIPVPPNITRFKPYGSSATLAACLMLIAETASGTMASATFQVWDAAGGTGNQLNGGSPTGPSAAGGTNAVAAASITYSTSGTIYIRQTANSANAGTISFYITIAPFP